MPTHRIWPTAVALPAAAVTILLVAACGSVEPGSDSAGNSAGTGGPSQTPSSETPPTEPPTSLGDSASAPVTVRGTVTQGVEAGCLMLGSYQLIVTNPEHRQVLRPGASVEVGGRPDPGMMTICQQGTPLVVSSARAL